jgi:hypothetical protein
MFEINGHARSWAWCIFSVNINLVDFWLLWPFGSPPKSFGSSSRLLAEKLVISSVLSTQVATPGLLIRRSRYLEKRMGRTPYQFLAVRWCMIFSVSYIRYLGRHQTNKKGCDKYIKPFFKSFHAEKRMYIILQTMNSPCWFKLLS